MLNAKKHIASGDCKDAGYVAFGALELLKQLPPGAARWVILCIGDTAADEVLAAKMLEA